MGETRSKKPSKRSVKAPKKGCNSKSVTSKSSDDSGTPSDILSLSASWSAPKQVPEDAPSRQLSIQVPDPTLIKIERAPGRGLCVFAARRIIAGTLVVAEFPLVRLTKTQEHDMNGDDEEIKAICIHQQYDALPRNLRKVYDRLYNTEKPGFSRQKSIFYSNCYNLDNYSALGGACIGRTASRINHSCCAANVQFSFADGATLTSQDGSSEDSESATSTDTAFGMYQSTGIMLMHAIRDIPKGKELLSNYLSPYLTSQQRGNDLQMHYKFVCECHACQRQGFWIESDERRLQMRICKMQIERAEKALLSQGRRVKQSQREMVGASNSSGLEVALAAVRDSTKLASLLAKEGLIGYDLAIAFHELTKWYHRSGDHHVARAWAEKERAICVTSFGQQSQRVNDIDLRQDGWWNLS